VTFHAPLSLAPELRIIFTQCCVFKEKTAENLITSKAIHVDPFDLSCWGPLQNSYRLWCKKEM
jgi:hypothetical protein